MAELPVWLNLTTLIPLAVTSPLEIRLVPSHQIVSRLELWTVSF
jgi:hypothetical protein